MARRKSRSGDMRLLGEGAIDRLAGLVFELAGQLHEERSRRMALEAALIGAGGLTESQLREAFAGIAGQEASRDAADASIRRLLTILAEDGGPEGPLRGEAP